MASILVKGIAAPFGVACTEVRQGCRPIFGRGSFQASIGKRHAFLTVNHDGGLVLATQAERTLTLAETGDGLWFHALVTDVRWTRTIADAARVRTLMGVSIKW